MSDFLQRLGVALPIVQAPMAGVSTPTMAAAASKAGALGSVAIGALSVEAAAGMIETVRDAAQGPFNVNVFCHPPAASDRARENAWLAALKPIFQRFGGAPPTVIGEIYKSFTLHHEMVDLIVAIKPPVVSLHFGLPPKQTIARLKRAGIALFSTATNLAEAEQADGAGVDVIIAQGYEAGGHRGTFDLAVTDTQMGVMALTRLLTNKINRPVIAAGGIMDGAGVAAALALGAEAAQLGTAFIGCPESAADRFYRAALFGPGASATEMTSVISGRPARCLPNKFTALKNAELSGLPIPDYPIAYDAGKALASVANGEAEGGFGANWAGQGAPMARSLPVDELIAALSRELRSAQAAFP